MSEQRTPPAAIPAGVAIRRRRPLLDLAARRARPGSGSSIETLMTRSWRDPDLHLRQVRTPFAIVGGVATALYMPLRLTLDLDLLVIADDAPALHAELVGLGCRQVGTLAIGGTTWETPGMYRVDLIESTAPWAVAAVQHPRRSPTDLPVIDLPFLSLMKLESSRAQDIADLSRMLGAADGPTVDRVRAAVLAYRPDDAEDLESLIALGRLEFQAP